MPEQAATDFVKDHIMPALQAGYGILRFHDEDGKFAGALDAKNLLAFVINVIPDNEKWRDS